MTDELSPEQEAAVRRLLAEARHQEPVPADIAARLDEALDGLVAAEGADDLEVFESHTSGSVTGLDGVRRRRRNAGRLLLAAAAVVIGGVAVGQVVGSTNFNGGGDDADSAADAAQAPREASSEPEAAAGGGSADTEQDGAIAAGDLAFLMDFAKTPLSLTSGNFAADVERELAGTRNQLRATAAYSDFDGLGANPADGADGRFVCANGTYGKGAKLPAYYDAEEAVLVLRRPRGSLQRVDLLSCGTAVELNTVNLPVQ